MKKIYIMLILFMTLISGCAEEKSFKPIRSDCIEVTILSINHTEDELIYVNPPYVIFDKEFYYDVLADNKTLTVKFQEKQNVGEKKVICR